MQKQKITIRPTIKQDEVYEALKVKDEVFYGGGAGGGKSWIICESRLINCYLFPGYRSFIGREELKRLMQSTYITWTKVCHYHKIPLNDWNLNGQYNYIQFKNGSRIDLLDLKYQPSDPLYERLGSLEYSDGAIDEAGEVDYLAYDVLKSRIGRQLQDRIRPTLLIGGNPKKNWTYREFYKPWRDGKLPDNKSFIQALYQDNPYTAEDYGRQLSKITDKVMRERLMLGNWEYENDETAMMNYESISDLFTNTIKEDKEKYLIVDASRFGADNTVYSVWKGLDWYKVVIRNQTSTEEIKQDIKDLAVKEMIPYSHILIDEDGGYGGSAVDSLKIKGFIANRVASIDINTGRPFNYKNNKAQCAYLMADKVNNREVRISFNDERAKELLIADLEQYKVKNPDADNKKQIISKDEMKEHLGRSPDLGDCLLMRMWFEIHKQPTYKDFNQPAYEYANPDYIFKQPEFNT